MTTKKRQTKPKPYQPRYPLFTRHVGETPEDSWIIVDQFPAEMDVSDLFLASADPEFLYTEEDGVLVINVANGRARYQRQEPQKDKKLASRGAQRFILLSCHMGSTPTMGEAETPEPETEQTVPVIDRTPEDG
ncbi:MAG TPA: hypothetical protein VNM48_22495 [Chloroflexota bacterium]|nr:hypothetical protein [Chloroflexota bacterium]